MVELKLHEQKKKKKKHYKHIYLQSHLGTMFNSVLTKKKINISIPEQPFFPQLDFGWIKNTELVIHSLLLNEKQGAFISKTGAFLFLMVPQRWACSAAYKVLLIWEFTLDCGRQLEPRSVAALMEQRSDAHSSPRSLTAILKP